MGRFGAGPSRYSDTMARQARGNLSRTPDSDLASITGVCMLLPVLVTLDTTVVNVAQRTFAAQFSATQAVVAWTMTAYTLALAGVIPLTGWAANRWGTKRLVVGSVLVFTIGSLLCALAPNIALLVAFRAVQGLGGGMLMPLQLIILARAAGPDRLGRALTISIIPVLMAPICGPILGGWLIDSFGWPWIFLINIPIGLLTLVLVAVVLPHGDTAPTAPFDRVGMVLLSPGLVLLLYGVSRIPERAGVTDPRVWVPAVTGLVMIAGFVVHAVRRSDRALIDLRLLRNRAVAAANATRFLFAVAFFGCCLLFPGYFQQVQGRTPVQSGMLLLPQTLGAAAVMPVIGRVMQRRGPRGIVLLGTGLIVAGLGTFVLGIDRQYLPALLAGLAVFGVGSGCLMIPVSWSAVQTLDAGEVAHGSTLFNVNHHTAAAIGAALMSVILTGQLRVSEPARAYSVVFVVAAILVATIAIPAWFLPQQAGGKAGGKTAGLAVSRAQALTADPQ